MTPDGRPESPKEARQLAKARRKAFGPRAKTVVAPAWDLSVAEGMRTLTITLPMPPNKGNMRGSSKIINTRKLRYFRLLAERRELGAVPPLEGWRPFACAEARATFYVHNFYDDTNAATQMKWPEDWLVKEGYLAGDSRECLRWTRYPEQIMDRRGESRMVITIMERDAWPT